MATKKKPRAKKASTAATTVKTALLRCRLSVSDAMTGQIVGTTVVYFPITAEQAREAKFSNPHIYTTMVEALPSLVEE